MPTGDPPQSTRASADALIINQGIYGGQSVQSAAQTLLAQYMMQHLNTATNQYYNQPLATGTSSWPKILTGAAGATGIPVVNMPEQNVDERACISPDYTDPETNKPENQDVVFSPEELGQTIQDIDRATQAAQKALSDSESMSGRILYLLSQKLKKITNGEGILILPLLVEFSPSPVTGIKGTPVVNGLNLAANAYNARIPCPQFNHLIMIPTGEIGYIGINQGFRITSWEPLQENLTMAPGPALAALRNLKLGLLDSVINADRAARGITEFTDKIKPLLQILEVENLLQTGKKATGRSIK